MAALRARRFALLPLLALATVALVALPAVALACFWCPFLDGVLPAPGIPSVDQNFNGCVNLVDFAIFASRFGIVTPLADFNCSGGPVNVVDFAIFAAHYNHPPGC